MKISELLRYKVQVEAIEVERLLASTQLVTTQIQGLLADSIADSKTLSKLSVSSSFNAKNIQKQIDSELSRINFLIESLEPTYLNLSSQMAATFYSEDIAQKITNRPIDKGFEQFTIDIIKKYADYRYAGCELFPVSETFTRSLVAFEPLYLFDPNQENLNIVVSQFNDAYKHKLRTYNHLENLPKNTIGFVSAINTFERFDIEIIDNILSDLNNCMSEGSSLVFSFNDCSNWYGVNAVESGIACYQTKKLLKDLLDKHNFVDTIFTRFKDNMAIAETNRPGILSSIKESSVIGRVININSLT
jgi:hypothetical protein